MAEGEFKVVELSSLKVEEGAHELFDSPDMRPYVRLLTAVVQGSDVMAELEAIRQVPLESR